MKKQLLLSKLMALIILCTAHNALLGLYVWNNTSWNIKYKFAKPDNDNTNEYILEAGKSAVIHNDDFAQGFSIRRSGKFSKNCSYWYEVPIQTLYEELFGAYATQPKNEFLVIESGLLTWSFKLETMQTGISTLPPL